MNSTTPQRIQELIRKNPGIRAKGIIQHFNFNPTGLFKHLRRLQERNLIYKVGKPPEVRYYTFAPMDTQSTLLASGINWAISGDHVRASQDRISPTRDVFQARTDHLVPELHACLNNVHLVSLLVAVVGEIGNNSFDHNLGHWLDIPGVYFHMDTATREIVLADRGQGVYATIRRVRPTIQNEADALHVAFTEIISGRAPEKRGNGLKFVKKVITEQQLQLHYYTGSVMAIISGSELAIQSSNVTIPGTAAYITF